MESDTAFGKWCKEQEFGTAPKTLQHKREAWKEYSGSVHAHQQKIDDYTIWRRISGLNHLQKPRVLERLALFRNAIKPPQNRLQATQ